MEKDQIEQLKQAFEDLVNEAPFNGTVTHRTRGLFIARWKKYLEENKIHGHGYMDDLLKALKPKKKANVLQV